MDAHYIDNFDIQKQLYTFYISRLREQTRLKYFVSTQFLSNEFHVEETNFRHCKKFVIIPVAFNLIKHLPRKE